MEDFDKFLNQMGIALPKYIKILLLYTGFDNVMSLAKSDDEYILKAMETFARNEASNLFTNDELSESFGIHAKNIENFKTSAGHIILLKELCTRCKQQLVQDTKGETKGN